MLLPQVVSETNGFILRGKQKAAGLLLKNTDLAGGLLGVLVSQSLMMGFFWRRQQPPSSCHPAVSYYVPVE